MTDDPAVFWPCVLAPLAALGVTLALYWRTRRFLARASRAPGTIVSVSSEQSEVWRGEGKGSETVTSHRAHVRFALPDGSPVEFRSASLNDPPGQGRTVTVAYDPADPAGARIDDGVVWRPTVISACVTIPVLVIGIWSLIGDERPGGRGAFLAGIALLAILFVGWLGKKYKR